MNRNLVCLALLAVALSPAAAQAGQWLTGPSYYTHDPNTGRRVAQYSPIGPVYIQDRPDFQQSVYRHYDASITAGGASDHYHMVEEWGRPVRPYGEWNYPYRPYSVPYPAWGPPFGGLGRPAYYPGNPGGYTPYP